MHNLEKELNQLSVRYLLEYFAQCEITILPGRGYSQTELKAYLKIQEKFYPFLNYILTIFSQLGFVNLFEDKVEFLVDASTLPSSVLVNEMLIKFPEKKDLILLVGYFAEHYKKALSGEIPAISVLYPKADVSFLNPIINEMESSSNIAWIEKALQKLVYLIMKKKKPLNILEVGGGTGRLTWKLVSHPSIQAIKYYFTDLSRFFVLKAKEKALKNNIEFMEFSQFDIVRSAKSQGFQEASIDVLFAFNVVHATADLTNTLANLKSLLSSDGVLVLIEYTSLPIWLHTIWGFAEGWWYFHDKYRTITPLVGKSEWKDALFQAGFEKIHFLPQRNTINSPLSLLGIVAEKPEKQCINE